MRSANSKPGQRDSLSLSVKKRELLQRLLEREGLAGSKFERIAKRQTAGPVPLTFAQERLWFLNQLAPDSPAYNFPAAVRLEGHLDIQVLQRCLNEIVRRHEILRARFASSGKGPVQVFAPILEVAITVRDLRNQPESEREAEASRRSNEELRRPFDLSHGPLLRATLIRLDAEEHYLLVIMHHIIAEVWSSGILFRELATLYTSCLSGQPSPLPDLDIQYGDFAHWQRSGPQEDLIASQFDYWQNQLTGTLPVLQLPADRPRPSVQTLRGGWASRILPKSLRASLSALGQKESATLFMPLFAAFLTLLHRYTRQEEFLVGSPVAGRNRAETEELIGLFINTVVLRTDVSGNPAFVDLLRRVRNVCLGAYSHQDLPFEKLVEQMHPDRDLGHMPLFQVMFAFQNTPASSLDLPGLTAEWLGPDKIHNGTSKVDLALFIEETEAGLSTSFEYSSELFEASTVERMLDHFQVILETAVENPDLRISELQLIDEPERRSILRAGRGSNITFPVGRCVHELFEIQTEKTPDAVAVVSGSEILTYFELDRRANQLAHHLRRLGVGPEVVVGICCERGIAMIVGLLGVLKAGGAFLPLDPSYPTDRLRFMLEDSKAQVLLAQESTVSHSELTIDHSKLEVFLMDADWQAVACESDANPVNSTSTANLAYVIYTSGSTGAPKGVAIPHAGLLNLVFWHLDVFAVTAEDRATQLAGTSFDASVWEVWPYLTCGAALHLASPKNLASPEELRDWLVASGITISFVPTPLAERALSLDWPRAVALRALLTGGDKLHQAPSHGIPFQVVNNYGPTENTVVTTSGVVDPNSRSDASPSIGRPIANTAVYILDNHIALTPNGVPGELHVGGASLARGYFKQPAITAEQFIPDALAQKAGERVYRTGDLVRRTADENIDFLGRKDNQVKIRGYRIELGEIEAALNQHPAVLEAAVLYREDVAGEKRLVGYVVTEDDTNSVNGPLRSFLQEKLPEYMVPALFVSLNALPLTSNGKVDRNSLPAPEKLRPELEDTFVAPRTQVERVVATIWQETLHLGNVGLFDNFFDLGGHSLLLIEIHHKLRETFDRDISMVDMFKYPTVSSLAEYLSQGRIEGEASVEGTSRADRRRALMSQRKQSRSIA